MDLPESDRIMSDWAGEWRICSEPDGNPLPGDAEILGLRFNDPAGAAGQEVDGGLDPSFLGAVIKSADPFGGEDAGGGFLFSDWYGFYNPEFWPWIFHSEHQFQYVFPVTQGEAFIYDLTTEDFWWTTSAFNTLTFYSFNRGTFNFYFVNFALGDGDRQFVDLETEEFYSVPQP